MVSIPLGRPAEEVDRWLVRLTSTPFLRLADELGAAHVTFPAISTGIYGCPADLAATVAVGTLAAALRDAMSVERVTLVAYSGTGLVPLRAALRRACPGA